MPTFELVKQCSPKKSFRVASVMGKFDLQDNHIIEKFKGEIPIENLDWQIGAIIGTSGTGKTIIAKELFTENYFNIPLYKADTILDDMPKEKSITEITQTFNSVGFSSPPSWLKPYNVLSQGEQMRVNLARALLEEKELIVFDEFTSVVDRNIAKIGSFAVSKAIRRTDKKFIAVSCHFDFLEWLQPDWIFNTNSMQFSLYKKKRPEIKLSIYECKRDMWQFFRKYHYLNYELSKSSQCYIAIINNNLAGFIAIVHFPHPHSKLYKRVHRLVVLPDYQGIGIGNRFLEFIGKKYISSGYRYIITTSIPALLQYFQNSELWICKTIGINKPHKGIESFSKGYNRLTTSWEMKL